MALVALKVWLLAPHNILPRRTCDVQVSARPGSPNQLSFGWQRSQLLGAFFNGVFLLALSVSILLQAIERFITIQRKDIVYSFAL